MTAAQQAAAIGSISEAHPRASTCEALVNTLDLPMFGLCACAVRVWLMKLSPSLLAPPCACVPYFVMQANTGS
jgi:hypothetical protein